MKIKSLQRFPLVFAMLSAAVPALAQTTFTGRVVDGASGSVLPGATITNTVTGDMAISSNDGSFRVKGGAGVQTFNISFLGYQDLDVEVAAGQVVVGDVILEPDAITVADIVVTAGIVTRDRQTPVAVSDVSRVQIDMKLSNQEFPEILKSTPSVYATKQGGGYGDSRINIRGFSSENVGVLINGVPINDMGNGAVYWSNWAGLSEVTGFVQVQRGLGASKLGISSVGGTINIVTRSTDAGKGGNVWYGIGNDGFQRLSFSVSSGLGDNGWAFTMAGGRRKGEGYVRGTDFEAWNYFLNLSKVFAGGRHRLSLTAFGAPQWHNQRGNPYYIEDYHTHSDGRRMNRSWGWMDGKRVGTGYGYNVFHKPQISLVHTWDIDRRSMLSTSVYASPSKGNGRYISGAKSNWIGVNGGMSGDGRYYPDTAVTPGGQIDYGRVHEQNSGDPNGSQAIFGKSVNSHDWYGVLSSYNKQLTDEIKLTAGFDGRYFKSYHRRVVDDLLGGDYFVDPSTTPFFNRPAGTALREGDVYGYDQTAEVFWAGIFAQTEYVKGRFSAFLSGSATSHNHRFANYSGVPVDGTQRSKWVGFAPWSIKGGASRKLGRSHIVFANGGYFTRAPFRNMVFNNNTIEVYPDLKYERVTTAEAGYTFVNNVLDVTFNGYYTLWLDKTHRTSFQGESYLVKGLNARHAGLELEATYRPTTRLTLKAMGSLGDWIWRDDVNFTAYDGNQTAVGTYKAFIAGVHVGNSAQMTAALSADWEPLRNLRVGAGLNWFGKNFADYQPANRTEIQDKVDSWQLPDYGTVDLSLCYRFDTGGRIKAAFYGNINNLFDTWYIADARDGADHDARTALVYYGFGRTWTAGLKFNF